MKKNTADQVIGCQMVSSVDGSAFTGTVTVYVTKDGGSQTQGATGSGVCTHEGNGLHTYLPSQTETNADHIAFTFIGENAIPATVQVYTSYPQTGDAYAQTVDIDTEVDEIHAVVNSIAVTGSALNKEASDFTKTTGTTETLSYSATAVANGTTHDILDDTGTIDVFYQFALLTGVPANVSVVGRLNSTAPVGAGKVSLYAWRWDGTPGWELIHSDIFSQTTTTTNYTHSDTLLTRHVGTGDDDGLVKIRFYGTGLKSGLTTLKIDQILISFSNVGASASEIAADVISGFDFERIPRYFDRLSPVGLDGAEDITATFLADDGDSYWPAINALTVYANELATDVGWNPEHQIGTITVDGNGTGIVFTKYPGNGGLIPAWTSACGTDTILAAEFDPLTNPQPGGWITLTQGAGSVYGTRTIRFRVPNLVSGGCCYHFTREGYPVEHNNNTACDQPSVWDEPRDSHAIIGTFGSDGVATRELLTAIPADVWNATASTYSGSGTMGKAAQMHDYNGATFLNLNHWDFRTGGVFTPHLRTEYSPITAVSFTGTIATGCSIILEAHWLGGKLSLGDLQGGTTLTWVPAEYSGWGENDAKYGMFSSGIVNDWSVVLGGYTDGSGVDSISSGTLTITVKTGFKDGVTNYAIDFPATSECGLHFRILRDGTCVSDGTTDRRVIRNLRNLMVRK